MAGLMKQPMGGNAPMGGNPPAAERNPMNDPNATEGENVSPEEQAQYDKLVTNGMELMYNDKTMPQLLKSIASGGNPVEGVANALTTVFMRLEDSGEKAGFKAGGDVKIHAATELMEQMVELAEAAGIHEFTPKEMERAYLLATDNYRVARQKQGKLPVEELQSDMGALMQANEQGTLDEMAPGLADFAAKGQQMNKG